MAELLNFYGNKEIVAKIEYIVERYSDLKNNTVPFNAAVLISNPAFEDKQEIDGQIYDLHNTIWMKLRGNNGSNEYRCIANHNINGIILRGCDAETYDANYTELIQKEETNQ